MNNRFMRIIVMFDLPVITDKEKKTATKFRKFLLDEGFIMMQYSVYSRICKNNDELYNKIINFDDKKYLKDVNSFLRKVNCLFIKTNCLFEID